MQLVFRVDGNRQLANQLFNERYIHANGLYNQEFLIVYSYM